MNDDKRTRYTRRGALGLMALGGGFAILETLGFDQTTSERDTTIAVDDDGSALLGIDENPPNGSDETVKFINRADKAFDPVTLSSGGGVAFDEGRDDTLEPEPSFTLKKSGQSGDETLVDVVRTSGSGDADVDITATLSSTTISATRTLAAGSSSKFNINKQQGALSRVGVTAQESSKDFDDIKLTTDGTSFTDTSVEDFVPRRGRAFQRVSATDSSPTGDSATLDLPGSLGVDSGDSVVVSFDSSNVSQSNINTVALRDSNDTEISSDNRVKGQDDILQLSLSSVSTNSEIDRIRVSLGQSSGDLSGADAGTFITTIDDADDNETRELRINSIDEGNKSQKQVTFEINSPDNESLKSGETLRIRVSGNTATLPSGGETVDLTLLESDGTTVINRFTASV